MNETNPSPALFDPSRRMLVIVPPGLNDTAGFAQKIHWLALQQQRSVFYLTLADRDAEELVVARTLTTLEALTSDALVRASGLRIEAPGWLEALRPIVQPGDRVICHAEQFVRAGLFQSAPLAQALEETGLSVHILSGFYRSKAGYFPSGAKVILFWLFFVLLLAGFTLLEFRINNEMAGGLRQAALAGVFLIEFGLIYRLNELSNR
jgi:hypothetical protein